MNAIFLLLHEDTRLIQYQITLVLHMTYKECLDKNHPLCTAGTGIRYDSARTERYVQGGRT
jgi:hypothetical protein